MTDKIQCPNCGHKFDVEEALSGQLENKYREEFQRKIEKHSETIRKQQEELEKQKKEFEVKKERENELFNQRLQKKLSEETEKYKKEIQEKSQIELQSLKEENEKKKQELIELRTKEIGLLKRENELKEQKEQLELDLQKRLLEQSKEIEERGRIKEREVNELREKEYQKQLEDQKKLIEEMKRKAEQGSMQLQGEIQELAIEEYLQEHFPFDTIEEIKKGVQGGDCIQHINTRELSNCGRIYYESKRTKAFSEQWIDKLKSDMQNKQADIGVIVTETMPNDMDRMGMRHGVWICDFTEFKGLSFALRESLIALRKNTIAQENKGDKMSLLYDYLTSQEFKLQIETIVEGFVALRNQLETEKRVFQRQWKEREKQIDRVLNNTINMHASIKGIAGNAIPKIGGLEFDDPEDEYITIEE